MYSYVLLYKHPKWPSTGEWIENVQHIPTMDITQQ